MFGPNDKFSQNGIGQKDKVHLSLHVSMPMILGVWSMTVVLWQ